jgi:protein-disulfide isomerase
MERRQFMVSAGTAISATALAGCTGSPRSDNAPEAKIDVEKVDSLPNPVEGGGDDAVLIRGFYDYLCGHCSRWYSEMYPWLKENFIDTGDVQHQYWNLLVVSEKSYFPMNATRAVQDELGDEAFWEFSRHLHSVATDAEVTRDWVIDQAPDEAREAVSEAVRGNKYNPVIRQNSRDAQDYGARSTPSLEIGGELLSGDSTFNRQEIAEKIRDAQ